MKRFLKRTTGPVMLYSLEGPENVGDPVHENLALAALYQQRYLLGLQDADFSDLWEDPSLNEFLRGVFWNDDPAVLMFDTEHPYSDSNFSSGVDWSDAFFTAKALPAPDLTNLTGRSHFWDLQFVHGMACATGEPAATTRYRALMWAEFMYKVAVGEPVVSGGGSQTTPASVAATKLKKVAIPKNPRDYDSSGHISETIATYFTSATDPTGDDTVDTLINEGDWYTAIDTGKRAIGSVMHLIQDSYARGHTRRALQNPTDLACNGASAITFKAGTYGNWGGVITFHTYKGQDESQHSAFDADTSTVPLDPRNLRSFNGIVGGRNAIDACQRLLAFFAAKTLWKDGPQALLESVFTLDANATVADTKVNTLSLSGLRNTGATTQGTDPAWKTIRSGTTAPAYVVTKDPNWVTPPTGAGWISPAANTSGDAGATWAYRLEFTLPDDVDPSSVVITGRCATDDSCTVVNLNDVTVAQPFDTDNPNYSGLVGFTLSGADGFKAGYNWLDFFVYNVGGPTGLLVVFDAATALPAR